MADEYDYTKMWDGVFTPFPVEEDGGIYLLDDETSVGRNTQIYDGCTRVLYDDAHPRASPGGRRYPGPMGAGRASDRVGPSPAERRDAMRYASLPRGGDGFRPRGGEPFRPRPRGDNFCADCDAVHDDYDGGAGDPAAAGNPTPGERARYVQGSRRLGHPGPRGMVTSRREAREAVDGVNWSNLPPHYAEAAPNEYAHLFINPDEKSQGPPLYWSVPGYPGGIEQVDAFEGSPGGSKKKARPVGCVVPPLEVIKLVLFFLVVVLAATWLMITCAERRISSRLSSQLAWFMAAQRTGQSP